MYLMIPALRNLTHDREHLARVLQTNSSKEQIKASHLVPKYPPKSKDGKLPCVVYCHCNSGSRRDSEEALHLLLPQNITVFALDFVVMSSGYLEF